MESELSDMFSQFFELLPSSEYNSAVKHKTMKIDQKSALWMIYYYGCITNVFKACTQYLKSIHGGYYELYSHNHHNNSDYC